MMVHNVDVMRRYVLAVVKMEGQCPHSCATCMLSECCVSPTAPTRKIFSGGCAPRSRFGHKKRLGFGGGAPKTKRKIGGCHYGDVMHSIGCSSVRSHVSLLPRSVNSDALLMRTEHTV